MIKIKTQKDRLEELLNRVFYSFYLIMTVIIILGLSYAASLITTFSLFISGWSIALIWGIYLHDISKEIRRLYEW